MRQCALCVDIGVKEKEYILSIFFYFFFRVIKFHLHIVRILGIYTRTGGEAHQLKVEIN